MRGTHHSREERCRNSSLLMIPTTIHDESFRVKCRGLILINPDAGGKQRVVTRVGCNAGDADISQRSTDKNADVHTALGRPREKSQEVGVGSEVRVGYIQPLACPGDGHCEVSLSGRTAKRGCGVKDAGAGDPPYTRDYATPVTSCRCLGPRGTEADSSANGGPRIDFV